MPPASRASSLISLDEFSYPYLSSLASRILIREGGIRSSSCARGISAILGSQLWVSSAANLGWGCSYEITVSIIIFCCSRITSIVRSMRFSFNSSVSHSCISLLAHLASIYSHSRFSMHFYSHRIVPQLWNHTSH